MAQVTYPGVYVEEVPSGVRPIAAASTSIAAFIGVAERGPLGEAVKVFNFTEYQNRYGGFLPDSFLSHAVYHANDSVTYTSTVYGATETVDHRYAGSTTIDVRNTAKWALRGKFGDFQTFTSDVGQNGERTDENL